MQSAEAIYSDVVDEAGLRGYPCVAGYALTGLGNLAIMRGNRPAQLRFYTEALRLAPADSALEAAARWGLMNHALAVESLADALIHGWRAFDLTTNDEERAGILSNLASVALRAGFHEASFSGFEGALRIAGPVRLWLSIASSAAEAAGALLREDRLLSLEEEGRRRNGTALPFEQTQWLLGLARGWEAVGAQADRRTVCPGGARPSANARVPRACVSFRRVGESYHIGTGPSCGFPGTGTRGDRASGSGAGWAGSIVRGG